MSSDVEPNVSALSRAEPEAEAKRADQVGDLAAEERLLVPENDVDAPVLSIVIPALNESLTIEEFIDWCMKGLADAKVKGEILIIDSSTDDTAALAVKKGARVLQVPKRGLGRAYIDAMPHIRGKYILMGDCDCTYDFREVAPFMEKFQAGCEFIMGSRFRGSIEEGAMPPLHRYFGTPFTTWILNTLYGSSFTDIHCGMRGITKDGFARMRLQSQSWEYASEMVLKSVHMKLQTAEVPVKFYKDKEGRLSHHKRSGWFSPWAAGWINLRAMLVYGADFFLLRPGFAVFLLGLLLSVPATMGPVSIGGITLSLYGQMLGLTLAVGGLQSFYAGCIARVLYDYTNRVTDRWLQRFAYTRTVLGAFVAALIGLGMTVPLVDKWIRYGFELPAQLTWVNHLAITGLLLLTLGLSTFAFTLLLHAVAVHKQR